MRLKISEKTSQIQQIQQRQKIRVENRKDIIFRVNRRNRFVFVNKAMEILTGCSRYGRVATLAGALNQRVDLTAPITTLAHAVHHCTLGSVADGTGGRTVRAVLPHD